MKKTLFATVLLAGMASSGVAADKLKSFDHAAELTSQAKTILFQELNTADVPNTDHQQIVCLAENIYFEARAESMEGKAAVANVTRNRVEDKRWPGTYCEVVQQGPVRESWKTKQHADLPDDQRVYYPRKHRCQFSWYCDGKSDEVKDKKTYQKILDFARLIMHNDIQFVDITDGATHYHADYVKPDWAKAKTRTTEIGDHIFYRWEKK